LHIVEVVESEVATRLNKGGFPLKRAVKLIKEHTDRLDLRPTELDLDQVESGELGVVGHVDDAVDRAVAEDLGALEDVHCGVLVVLAVQVNVELAAVQNSPRRFIVTSLRVLDHRTAHSVRKRLVRHLELVSHFVRWSIQVF
jgi:hypothetical protein